MKAPELKRILEGVLLCSARPLALNDLKGVLEPEFPWDAATVQIVLRDIQEEWRGRAVELDEVAGGWRFRSALDIGRFVHRLAPDRVPRYSRAVMETLAIIAYRQPVTRGDIEEIRGVTVSTQIIRALEERGWIDQVGTREVLGRPALFATTRQFLDDLGLTSLAELPLLDSADGVGAEALASMTQIGPPGVESTPIAAESADGAGAVHAGAVPDGPADTADAATHDGVVDREVTVDEALPETLGAGRH